jgi:hypothetical protein
MPAKLFKKILQDLKGCGCTISITETGILFESDTSALSVLDTKHCEVIFNVKRPARATFLNIEYMKLFALANFASAVKLSMGPHMSLMLEYRSYLSEASFVKYFLSSSKINDCEVPPGSVLSAAEVDLLSSRLQSCKEVLTDQQKTRAAKKPPARKRKRAESKEKKPARKKAAMRTKPKKCSVCKLIKSCEEYFPAQLSKTTKAKCIDCMVVGCRNTMMAWQEERASGPRDAAQRREEARVMRSLRCERYECPIFFEYGQGTTIAENLQASFVPTVPDVGKLLGSYDLVYTCSDDGTYRQHAISGELCLESRNDGLMRGSFQISPVISDFVEPGARSFAVAQTTSDSEKAYEIPIQLSDPIAGASLDLSTEGGHTGTVRVLAQRTATGWFPFDLPSYKRLIAFDTVDEAEALMKRRQEAFLANSWINNHLSFPTELALKIHEYVAFLPPFAFVFEKGDLWITLDWKKADGSVLRTTFVARRRAA